MCSAKAQITLNKLNRYPNRDKTMKKQQIGIPQGMLIALLIFVSTSTWGFKQGSLSSERNHQLITNAALAPSRAQFVHLKNGSQIGFAAEALAEIWDANAAVDDDWVGSRLERKFAGTFFDSDFHFDEELFDRGSRNLISWRADIVVLAKRKEFGKARRMLGRSLHSVQDFYAHSNWVEPKIGVPASFPLPELGEKILSQPGTTGTPPCTRTGLVTDANLTSGWYSIAMHAGFTSEIANGRDFQTVLNDFGWYTNLWAAAQKTVASLHEEFPDNKCVHGGDHGPGLNKDDRKRTGFVDARDYAIRGSKQFFNYVLRDLAGNDEALCGLLGQESSRECTSVATNTPPIAVFSTSLVTAAVNTAILFDGGASADIDGTISYFTWSFGDGTSDIGPLRSHTYTRPGTYTVTLTVTDEMLATNTVTRDIIITPMPKPDLTPSGVTLGASTFLPGAPVTVNWKITNSGNANAAASSTELRLLASSDATAGLPANTLVRVPTNALASGTFLTQSQFVVIPATTVPGSYKIVVVVDGSKVLSQSNLTNDFAGSPAFNVAATSKPDLVPNTISVSPASVAPGATITVNWKITNSGNANAAASTTILRLVSTSDLTNGTPANNFMTVATGALAIGASVSQSQVITIPASTAPGSYKIVVVADSVGSVGQSNLTNDFASSGAFTVGSVAPGILNPANGHRYEIVDCGTWTQCYAVAKAKGGDMVTIRSKSENDWILANFASLAKTPFGFWIGMNQQSGSWKWGSGDSSSYTNWAPDEPNIPSTDVFAHMYSGVVSPGAWNNTDDVGRSIGIVQAIIEYSDAILFDTFNGAAIDLTKWTVGPTCCGFSGTATVGASALTLGATANIDTRGKVTVNGDNTITIEARMVGPGANRDTTIALVDVVSGAAIGSAAQSIEFGDTNYSAWGFRMNGYGAYNFVEVERPSGIGPAPQNATVLGGSTNAYMEYRLTITGNKVKMERGPTLANITESVTRTLGQSSAGKSFYIRLNTGGDYSPAVYDWVRVTAQPLLSGTFSVAANNPAGSLFTVPSGTSSCTFNASGNWSGGGNGFIDGSGFASLGPASTVSPSLSFNLPSAPVSSLIVSTPSNGYVLNGVSSTISTVPGTSMYFKINDSVGNFGDNAGSLTVSYTCR